MRQIGSTEDRQHAERLAAYLVTRGITCSVDSGDSGHAIWVQDEDRIAEAKEEFARYQADPDDERYRDATRQAAIADRERSRKLTEIRQRTVDLRERWNRPAAYQGPATFGLLALMMVVGVLTGFNPVAHPEFLLRTVFSTDGTGNQIWSGEVWRLFSPIFLHFGILHFLFNLIALRDLGLLVESRLGTPRFFGMVLVIAAVSNYAQFALSDGIFGGMSGVNYGLFGYVWVRGRLDPDSGLWIHPTTVTYMLGWFVLCFIGVIPHVANWAHAGGLCVGAAFGVMRPVLKSLQRR